MAGKDAQEADQPSLLDEPTQSEPTRPANPDGYAVRTSSTGPSLAPEHRRAVASALWAAWGDAVGFISELTTLPGLMRRLNSKAPLPDVPSSEQLEVLLGAGAAGWPLQSTVEWTRRIGGRNGPTVKLPSGAYSDDTQLRLATSRCIDRGRFSVEHFASIELPAFTSYGLGGGHATKAGAAAMLKTNVPWAAPGHDSWANAGGNGVVMRVAPLAYAAEAHEVPTRELVLGVLRNGVVTHGHPRALLPACLHAVALAESLRRHRIAPISELHRWLEDLSDTPASMAADPDLGELTLPAFESTARRTFADAWAETTHELHEIVDRFARIQADPDPVKGYLRAAHASGLFKKSTLGAGTTSFVAAYWLADTFRHDPVQGLLLAANAVGTDTDTIATIAGAHLGAEQPFAPHGSLLDAEYIEAETIRLVSPDHPRAAPPMRYPNLDTWWAPRTQADYVGVDPNSGRVAVAGLGTGEWVSSAMFNTAHPDFAWQWFATDYGQTLPVKRRPNLEALPASALSAVPVQGQAGQPTVQPSAALDELRARMDRANQEARKSTSTRPPTRSPGTSRGGDDPSTRQLDRPDAGPAQPSETLADSRASTPPALTFDSAVAYAEEHRFAPDVVGRLTQQLTTRVSPEAALAFVGVAVRFWRSR